MPSRRAILRKIGISTPVILAGCLNVDGSNMAYISVTNYMSKPVSGEITVSQNGRDVFTEGFELTEGSKETPTSERYDDIVEDGGTYTIEVALDSGRSASYEWNVPDELGQSIRVSIRADNIEFTDLVSASD